MLKKTIAEENSNKEKELKELNDIAKANHEQLEKSHKEEIAALEKKIKDLDTQLTNVKGKNNLDEKKLRDEYKKADRLYSENLANYDAEMKEHTNKLEQAKE